MGLSLWFCSPIGLLNADRFATPCRCVVRGEWKNHRVAHEAVADARVMQGGPPPKLGLKGGAPPVAVGPPPSELQEYCRQWMPVDFGRDEPDDDADLAGFTAACLTLCEDDLLVGPLIVDVTHGDYIAIPRSVEVATAGGTSAVVAYVGQCAGHRRQRCVELAWGGIWLGVIPVSVTMAASLMVAGVVGGWLVPTALDGVDGWSRLPWQATEDFWLGNAGGDFLWGCILVTIGATLMNYHTDTARVPLARDSDIAVAPRGLRYVPPPPTRVVPRGVGTATLATHDTYVGNWQKGEMCGGGTMRYKDGRVYVHRRHGTPGVLRYPDGGRYIGEVKTSAALDVARHGEGTMWYADGSVYSGAWSDDRRPLEIETVGQLAVGGSPPRLTRRGGRGGRGGRGWRSTGRAVDAHLCVRPSTRSGGWPVRRIISRGDGGGGGGAHCH